MSWLVGLVWGIAAVVAIVVLGYCALDIRWKAARLAQDLAGLAALRGDLVRLQAEIASAARRLPVEPGGG